MTRSTAVPAALVLALSGWFGGPAGHASTSGQAALDASGDVPTLGALQLAERFDEVLVVDVRSALEYELLRIRGAEHVSVSNAGFAARLADVRQPSGGPPLVLYCNGPGSAKSERAVRAALESGFRDVFAFADGIAAWVAAHPDLAELHGDAPVAPTALIPDEEFRTRQVESEEFRRRAALPEALLVDVRDPLLRAEQGDVPGARQIPFDRLVPLLEHGEFRERDLLILDAAGDQVRWLQYYLDAYEYRRYAFLRAGAAGS